MKVVNFMPLLVWIPRYDPAVAFGLDAEWAPEPLRTVCRKEKFLQTQRKISLIAWNIKPDSLVVQEVA